VEEEVCRLGLSELRELRQLREENGKLKRLVADLLAGPPCPAGDHRKKAVRPRARRELAEWARQVHQFSERRAAGLIPVNRATLRYHHHRDPQQALRVRLRELAGSRVRYGYRRLTVMRMDFVARVSWCPAHWTRMML
jgi:hypothetical protein